jgi:asparagine synthase (glutamine-hydrolysing)
MCGFAGIVAADRLRAEERARLTPMRDVLAHRGPDEAGTHLDDQAGLVHRRLSIVDLASGQQPLSNEDGAIWIAYNGEVYNHADIRRELEAKGHVYRTKSDTETIVHAYEEWGAECAHRFRGMFAFALWDSARRRLLLVRDRLGIKPLYWCRAGDRLVFGSEIKAILESGLVRAEANEALLAEVLTTRYSSDEETLYKGIYRLPPGHVLIFEEGRTTVRQYWDIPTGEPTADLAFPEMVSRFRGLLEESVKLRLMSDVPLGMFLSGGIDSSVIAALMARMIDRPLRTFSVAFEDRAFSELEYARQVSRAIKADAHEIVIGEREFFGALPRLVWHEDEPIAHPSSVPLYFVSRLARDHVKVVLTGEGSDELLAGYGKYPRSLVNWHAGSLYRAVAPDAARAWVRDRVVPRLPSRLGRYVSRSFLGMPQTPEALFFDAFAGIPLQQLRTLATPAMLARARDPYATSRSWLERPRAGTPLLNRLLYADLRTYLVELLMKQDQMSMAASIESRVPFLDHHLVEFAAMLPPAAKLRGFTTKRLLRAAARDLLPPEIVNRPKMGFPVPFGRWMRGPWSSVARDVLLDRRARERGLIDAKAVERLLEAHRSGAANNGDAIWGLINLGCGIARRSTAMACRCSGPQAASRCPKLSRRSSSSPRGSSHERPLAERRAAAAARQRGQAAHVALDAPSRAAPRHHLPVVRRPGSAAYGLRRDAGGMRAARDGPSP